MKRWLVILVMPLVGLAQQNSVVVKGQLKGLNEGTQLMLNSVDGHIVASGKIANGLFTLKGQLAGTDIVRLMTNNGTQQMLELFLAPDETVTVTGNWADLNSVIVKGAAGQPDFEVFRKATYPYLTQRQNLVNSANMERDPAKRNAFVGEISRIDVVIPNIVLQFVKDRPSSAVSTWALYFTSPLFENQVLQLENAYAKLQQPAKKLLYTGALEQYIATGKVGMVGSQALDFTQNDAEGKLVKLSSFKGKYVLVDFWASWCGPCRGENPNVVSAYEKYKNKNFTVLGVSLDQAKPNWLKAIKDDNLTWTNVSDLQYFNNSAARLYNIQSIPSNLLIDPSGKIIAKNLRGEQLIQKLAEVLK